MLKYQFQFQHMINLINSDKQLTLTYLSKGTPCNVQCMVTIILQIEFECLESGTYKSEQTVLIFDKIYYSEATFLTLVGFLNRDAD